jgi:hypothetical protein
LLVGSPTGASQVSGSRSSAWPRFSNTMTSPRQWPYEGPSVMKTKPNSAGAEWKDLLAETSRCGRNVPECRSHCTAKPRRAEAQGAHRSLYLHQISMAAREQNGPRWLSHGKHRTRNSASAIPPNSIASLLVNVFGPNSPSRPPLRISLSYPVPANWVAKMVAIHSVRVGGATREMAPARILAHVGPVVSLILASLPYLAVAAACAYFLYPAIH